MSSKQGKKETGGVKPLPDTQGENVSVIKTLRLRALSSISTFDYVNRHILTTLLTDIYLVHQLPEVDSLSAVVLRGVLP
jgi:hypothetical protein